MFFIFFRSFSGKFAGTEVLKIFNMKLILFTDLKMFLVNRSNLSSPQKSKYYKVFSTMSGLLNLFVFGRKMFKKR